VAERLIAPVLKTGRPKGLVSSNLTPSAPLAERAQEIDCITVSHNNSADFRRYSTLLFEVSSDKQTKGMKGESKRRGGRPESRSDYKRQRRIPARQSSPLLAKRLGTLGHAAKDQSNQRRRLPDYAVWEIHPAMKLTVQ
jgi:hypothetical protein